MNAQLKEQILKLRGHIEGNLKFLATEYLNTKHWSKVHDDLMKFLKTAGKRIHIELPRGHLKSWIVTQAWTIQEMLKNPDIRILLCFNTETNATRSLRFIRSFLTEGGYLSQFYGRFETEVWSQEELVIRQRKTPSVAPTFMAAGLQKALTSQHFDVIVADDLVDPENVRTKEQRDKVYEFYLQLHDLLEPDGKLVVIGTRYHQDDLYAKIAEEEGWSRFIRPCFKEDGTVLFPEKFTVESLRAIQNKPEPEAKYHFAAQYLLNPIDPESADFRAEWIKTYEPSSENPGSLYLTVDPALSLSKDADYSALVVAGMFGSRRIRVVDAVHRRMVPSDLVDAVFALVAKWRLHRVGIETFAFQKTLKYEIQRQQRERGIFFSIDELGKRHSGRGEQVLSKEARIRRLQPYFEQGLVEIRSDMSELRDELLSFPRGKHDDLIDALSYQLDYLVPSLGHSAPKAVIPGSMRELVKRMESRLVGTAYEEFMRDLQGVP
jgi:predicted phage terminase large subunit-like protein